MKFVQLVDIFEENKNLAITLFDKNLMDTFYATKKDLQEKVGGFKKGIYEDIYTLIIPSKQNEC